MENGGRAGKVHKKLKLLWEQTIETGAFLG
jgi:hypothetical protein